MPPLIDFACSACADDKQEERAYTINGDYICEDCVTTGILPSFHQALEHEINWPVTWGNFIINARGLEALLGEDFMERYKRREIEYNTLPKERIYCTHLVRADKLPAVGDVALERLAFWPLSIQGAQSNGTELVKCGAMVSKKSANVNETATCYHCRGTVCTHCAATLPFSIAPHECEDTTEEDHPVDTGELVRGKDFQKCPTCDTISELKDGCNYIRCPGCRKGFCFICGEGPLDHDGPHWRPGMPCPRFYQPDAPDARHDPEVPPDAARNTFMDDIQNVVGVFPANVNRAMYAFDRLNLQKQDADHELVVEFIGLRALEAEEPVSDLHGWEEKFKKLLDSCVTVLGGLIHVEHDPEARAWRPAQREEVERLQALHQAIMDRHRTLGEFLGDVERGPDLGNLFPRWYLVTTFYLDQGQAYLTHLVGQDLIDG